MFSGSLVKKAREDRGLKAYYIARKAKISPWYLSMIENNKRSPALETLQAIADAVEIEVTEFFLAPNVSDSLSSSQSSYDDSPK
ncbi:helix-turn-helix domain-containing protein [Desulfitobacterium metallireducens]|uniref:DNA-binding protein n=1 Tax=Desulfitobacterium metallireducens DSM 15288 TaxID=871968 RepID=W0EDY0_9FIRM|nr:helix-turn-helix transcriptional regulator [Desulfitobacterium metallireducens]AHF07271.1 DNA-binding protein [Desulfitobacterium metallireducens DSM 15288]